jgi:hypothetical protein
MFKIKFLYPDGKVFFLARFTYHWINNDYLKTPVFTSAGGLREGRLFKNEEMAWSYWLHNGKNSFEMLKNQGVMVSVEKENI